MWGVNVIALDRHKYAVLLTLVLVTLAIQSFDAQPGTEGNLSDAFRTLMSIAIFLVVFERHRARALIGLIVGLTVAVGWGRHLAPARFDYVVSLALHAMTALFLCVAVWTILRDLFRQSAIGAENVLGAICGYLIAGDAWGSINAITYLVMPAVYGVNPAVDALLANWHGQVALFSYYSITQMLTLGYSDVTPVRAPATTLSLLTTLFGVFYTAIIVSQFVGLAQASRRKTPRDP